MLITRSLTTLLLTVLASAFAGCGDDVPGGGEAAGGAGEQPPPGQEQGEPAADQATGGGQSCDDIPVPGHEGTNVRVQGVGCTEAAEIVGAAVGKGRQAYEAAGFACEPSPTGGGDTNYACTQGDARVSFRYGAA